MGKKINRRQFLKDTVKTTSCLSVGCFTVGGFTASEPVECGNCGSASLTASFFIFQNESVYCHDCGINRKTLKFDVSCNENCSDARGKGQFPGCCQIPFPNHNNLLSTKKPPFSTKELKF